MVSLAQMTVAGIAGYAVAMLGTSSSAEISLELAVVGRGARSRSPSRPSPPTLHRLAVGAHRGHLHHHDHAGDRRRLLLPGAAELQRVQRLPGPARAEAADGLRHRLARSRCRSTSSRWCWRSPATCWCKLGGARALRHRAAGHPRQPAAHERARLQRHRAPRRRLRAGRRHRGGRRRAARLVQRADHAGLGRHLLAHQHPRHRGARRHAAPDRRRSSARWSSCCCRPSPST